MQLYYSYTGNLKRIRSYVKQNQIHTLGPAHGLIGLNDLDYRRRAKNPGAYALRYLLDNICNAVQLKSFLDGHKKILLIKIISLLQLYFKRLGFLCRQVTRLRLQGEPSHCFGFLAGPRVLRTTGLPLSRDETTFHNRPTASCIIFHRMRRRNILRQ